MRQEKIKISVLFSQVGHMAVPEQAHIQGVLLACEEINQDVGNANRQLEPIILSPDGDDLQYAQMATKLLVEDDVNTIFGCCLSTAEKLLFL